jgi:putative MFS transporter
VYINLVGAAVLPLPLQEFQPWRLLALFAAMPIALACFGWLLIDESPTWLQEAGREDEAISVLYRIAQRSGVALRPFELTSLARTQKPSPVEPLQQPYRYRTLFFSAVWFLGLFGYFGASLGDTKIFSSVPGRTNYGLILFSACGEFLAVVIMQFVGKRSVCLSMVVAFTAGGVAVYGELLDISPDVLAIVVFVGRAGVMAACCGYWAATPLAFPSRIRCTAMSYASFCGRLGGLLATLVAAFSLNVQVMAFGSANLVAAVLVFAFRWNLQPHEDCGVATGKLPEGVSPRDASGTIFSKNTKAQALLSGV